MELLLIRHAQSQNNALPESERVEDPGITELGRRQAEALARRLPDWEVELLLCSAFRRALETAEPLATASGLRPRVWAELHENGGCYAGHLPGKMSGRPGLNSRQIAERFPGFEVEGRIADTGWWSCQPRESIEQSRRRAQLQSQRLLEVHAGRRRVACVVHADFKALMLEVLLGPRWAELADQPLYNTGVTWLHCEHGRVQALKRFNDVAHLPPDAISD